MYFIFDRNNLVDFDEWSHEAYLKNSEDIYKLKIQNEQLLERLQDTCSSSHVLDCKMVDCLKDSHDMVDHEKFGTLNVLDVFEYVLEEIKTLCWFTMGRLGFTCKCTNNTPSSLVLSATDRRTA